MSKYKVGDAFIVKLGGVYEGEYLETLYQVDGFKSLVFDDYGLDKLEAYDEIKEKLELIDELKQAEYNRGLQDAWELVKKLYSIPKDKLYTLFDTDYPLVRNLIEDFTPQEALAKIEAYEKSQQIQVGDVVYTDDEPDSFGVVTWVAGNIVYVMWEDGSCGRESDIEELHKTGRHIDISSILEQIRGNE